MAGNKVLTNVAGVITEVATNNSSAGAGDANKIVSLNDAGILDATVINSKTTSAGAGDIGKIPALNALGILDDTILNASVTSSADKMAKLDGAGRLDITVMPVGFSADTSIIVASEALAAGDLVNVWNNDSVANVRKADATTAGKDAQGFVLAAVSSSANATVYFEGSNTAVTGRTPGKQFLATVAGTSTATAPSAAGNVAQVIGFATSATSVNFRSGLPITLA